MQGWQLSLESLAFLGISTDNVRDSGQTFVFGRSNAGEQVDEKAAMQIPTVYAWPLNMTWMSSNRIKLDFRAYFDYNIRTEGW